MQTLADEQELNRLINALATQIQDDLNLQKASAPWAIVGIRSRGEVIADRLATILRPDHLGALDITLYRDDLSEVGPAPIVRETHIPFNVDGMSVVLVDDVLMTGRSVRAAIQSLMDLGRPRRIWLSVLVDRGGRELPIAPDHVALNMTAPADRSDADRTMSPPPADDLVKVQIRPVDSQDGVIIEPGAARRRQDES